MNDVRLAVGMIGESENAMSLAFFTRLLACEGVRVAWFVDASITMERKHRLYGKPFSWGWLGDTVRAARSLRFQPKFGKTCRALARKHRIPMYFPRNRDVNSGLPDALYENSGADYVLVAGCDQILNRRAISLARKRIINFHWSILPGYRGKFVVFWQWFLKEPNIGFSFHEVDDGVDTGRLIYQEVVPHQEDEPAETIGLRIVDQAAQVLCRVFEYAEAGKQKTLPGLVPPSYFPAQKFKDLVTPSLARTVSEMVEVFRKFGYLRLKNGYFIGSIDAVSDRLLHGYELRDGLLAIPLADGHIASRIGRLRELLFARKILAKLD